jgi:hypothetical protein
VNRSESEQMHDGQPHPWWYITPPPWWSYLFGLLAVAGTAIWRVLSGGSEAGAGLFLHSLIWPGLVVGAVVTIVVWLGWTLELD